MTSNDPGSFFERYIFDVQKDYIGGGGFGSVYRAWDNVRDEWKAIKISEVKNIGGKEFSLISEVENSKVFGLNKNIAIYEEVHQMKMPNGVFDYAIMKYYEQGNLQQLLSSASLSFVQKKQIVDGLLSGIHFLHNNGIIHRDLKPSNILISTDLEGHYVPKIADFGLSKSLSLEAISQVTNSFGGGSLEYSSPEQLLGQKLYFNSDLWSLGVIAYEVFHDKKPFVSDNITGSAEAKRAAIFKNIVNATVPPIDPGIIPYDRLIRACLQKDPKARAPGTSDLYALLDEQTVILPKESEPDKETILFAPEVAEEIVPEEPIPETTEEDHEEEGKAIPIPPAVEIVEEEEIAEEIEEEEVISDADAAEVPEDQEIFSSSPSDAIEAEDQAVQSEPEPHLPIDEGAPGIKSEPPPQLPEEAHVHEIVQVKESLDEIAEEVEEDISIEEQPQKKKKKRRYLRIWWYLTKRAWRRGLGKAGMLWTNFAHNTLKLYHQSKRVIAGLLLGLLGLLGGYKGYEYIHQKYFVGPMVFQAGDKYGYISQERDTIHPARFISAKGFAFGRAIAESQDSIFYFNQKGAITKSLDKPQPAPPGEPQNRGSDDETDAKPNDEVVIESPSPDMKDQAVRDDERNDLSNNSREQKSIKSEDLTAQENTPKQDDTEDISSPSDHNQGAISNNRLTDSEKEPVKVKEDDRTTAREAEQPALVDRILKRETDPVDPGKSDQESPTTLVTETVQPASKKEAVTMPAIVTALEANLVSISGGQLSTGENTQNISSFKMNKYEVTQSLYKQVMGENPSKYNDCSQCPVENVSWFDVHTFIQRLNNLPGNPYTYRLPTEAEWEYAAMAQSRFEYAGSNDPAQVAVHSQRSGTERVGSKRPNGLSLYDMSGNVAEWVKGDFESKGKRVYKVVKGGSYVDAARFCTIKSRRGEEAAIPRSNIGFRLVRN